MADHACAAHQATAPDIGPLPHLALGTYDGRTFDQGPWLYHHTWAQLNPFVHDHKRITCANSVTHINLKREVDMSMTNIHYDIFSAPNLGLVGMGVSEAGICFVSMGDAGESEIYEALKSQFPAARVTKNPDQILPAREQLDEYLCGVRRNFDLKLDLASCSAFQVKVLLAAQSIPYGQTRSYGQLAQAVNNPKASRAVGNALSKNPVPIVVPCHRVLGADGSLCGFRGGLEFKRHLLRLEAATWNE
jgi:O-6-methylguanine DNA methyltransferase